MARHRITTGSDVAAFGLWDLQVERTRTTDTRALEEAAVRGDLLPVRTGGDGDYQVELWIDEPFAAPEGQRFEPVPRELGLHLPSGALVAEGLEHFDASPETPNAASVQLQPGWYRAHVQINRTDREELERVGSERSRSVLSPDEKSRYEELGRRYNAGCMGIVAAVLMATVAVLVRGRFGAVLGAIAIAVAAVAIARQRRVTRGTDYLKLHERVLTADQAKRPADFVIVLWTSEQPLPGGVVEAEPPKGRPLVRPA